MRAKILIVEENENNRLLMRAVLSYHGYDIIEAANGEEAVRAAREALPALIFMGIQLPVMDGLAAVKALKLDPATQGIKTVAVTAYAMKGDRENILEAGFDGYISKPIDTRRLPAIVEDYISQP
ncbi:response regulator [Candidatus Magnetominusculus dajiuhuensis]|uniref:response regulator n=1 Tax=Candidatus Magnetominusculus dajiuhuensis TaxID=3137712 RepID=UPI001A027783|nr:response regulator [Nitrospirota bacterium]